MIEINKIYKMDIMDLLNKLDDNSIDLIVADPPYNILKNEWDFYQDDKEYFEFMKQWMNLCFKKLKDGGSLYTFNTPRNSAHVLMIAEKRGYKLRNWITWDKMENFSFPKRNFVSISETILFFSKGNKNNFNFDAVRVDHSEALSGESSKKIWNNFEFFNPEGKLSTDIWRELPVGYKKKMSGEEMNHPSEKPEKIIEKIILASSNEGDIVLDLFSGTGTTSYVAKKFNRNFIACERNEEYIKYITKRLK